MSEKIDYSKGIYDARQLGTGRMMILGLQHMFAMFGATVLVPLLTGLSVSTTLLCAGLGTLLFHLVTKGKVPAFLGSSFAYLGGFSIVAPMLADADGNLTVANTKMLPYACAGVALSGILYLLVSLLISTFGILAAVVGAACYNKFKSTQMPDWLAFFSGKRFVAIATGLISIVVSVVLLFVWPVIFDALVAIGRGIAGMDGIGAGIYAFLNRLLIPTGLHHALNNVFWFDTIGLGDLSHFWAGETSADVGWSLGMYMSGFFPCMMFGIAGAALAMVRTAKNKKAAIGLVLSAAICAFVCGVTEPFEFGFMFLCFPLYVVYSALYGIFTIITYYSGFRAGFCFSAGATDLVFSASLPAAAKTWMIIPLGIAAFVVFYFVFYFAITKFDLKTPGREDEDAEEAEKKVVLANNNYTEVAAGVLKAIGGKENVSSVDYCATRLRFTIKDYTAVDEKAVKAAGAAGVIRPDKTTCQVIIGTKVQFVYDELKKML